MVFMSVYSVSASIVVYQSPLKDIQNIILKLQKSSFKIKIFIVDNYPRGSFRADDLHADVIYIASKNVGYGAGHNKAIKEIVSSDGAHFVINPDIDFDYLVIDKMVNKMIDNPSYSLIGPRLVGSDGGEQCNTKLIPTPFNFLVRRLPSVLSNALFRGYVNEFEMNNYDKTQPVFVPYLSGCFMLFRNSSLRSVGLFDERFFMYPEDVDISRRFFESGVVLFLPEFEVTHAWEGASRKSFKMFLIHLSNMVLYFNKWGWILDSNRKDLNKRVILFNRRNKRV
jgi:GT2 family glycosyltransferase